VSKLSRWSRFWFRKKSKQTIFMEALASMSDVDIVKVTEEALGYRLPQFNQHSERPETSALNDCKDDKSENMQRTSKQSNQGHRFVENNFEMEKMAVGFDDDEFNVEESSCPSNNANPLETNVNASHHRVLTSKIDLARKLSIFSISKSAESISKPPSVQPPAGDSSELCEVIIDGRSVDDAAGVGQVQPQQQRRIAQSGPIAQGDAAASSNRCLPQESIHKRAAAVRTQALSALTIHPRGTSGIKMTIQKSIESKDDENFGMECLAISSGVALPEANISPHPQPSQSEHVSTLKRREVSTFHKYSSVLISQHQNPSTDAQLQITEHPRSRSRSRNAVAAAVDPPASVLVVPPLPPRSRSSSRSRISAGAQLLAITKSHPDLTPPVALPVSDIAPLRLPTSLKRLPDAATHASGGSVLSPPSSANRPPDAAAANMSGSSVRAGPSSKKTGSRQPKKSTAQLMFEKQQAEYEESMQRMEKDGVSFAEC
jgi:hypothetical protein